MKRSCHRPAVAAVLGLAASLASADTLITFEEAVGITAMANSFVVVPQSARLSDQYLAMGALFSSTAGHVAVVDHYPPDPAATPTPPNIIGGVRADGVLDYAAPVEIRFVMPGNAAVLATTSSVSVLVDRFPQNAGTITMTAFDAGGAVLGSVSAADVGAIGTGASLSLSLAGIHRVVLSNDNGTAGYDNVGFGPWRRCPRRRPAR